MAKTNTKTKKEPEENYKEDEREKTIEQERDEYLIGWKRALADYENLKKDLMKERGLIRASVTEAVASAYLPIYDHLMSATQNTPDIPEAQKWFEGVGHIAHQCKETLSQFGVEAIDTKNQQFDPDKHEAVGTEYDESKKEDEILRETQTGFTMNTKVIRPSKVIVNKKTQNN